MEFEGEVLKGIGKVILGVIVGAAIVAVSLKLWDIIEAGLR